MAGVPPEGQVPGPAEASPKPPVASPAAVKKRKKEAAAKPEAPPLQVEDKIQSVSVMDINALHLDNDLSHGQVCRVALPASV